MPRTERRNGRKPRYFLLESAEGEHFRIDMKIKWQMEVLKLVDTKGKDEHVIRVHQLSSACLEKIVIWVEQHHYNHTCSVEWEETFFKTCELKVLFQFVTAGNALGMKHFLQASCLAIQDEFKGKSSEEIREILEQLWPPEQVEQYRQIARKKSAFLPLIIEK